MKSLLFLLILILLNQFSSSAVFSPLSSKKNNVDYSVALIDGRDRLDSGYISFAEDEENGIRRPPTPPSSENSENGDNFVEQRFVPFELDYTVVRSPIPFIIDSTPRSSRLSLFCYTCLCGITTFGCIYLIIVSFLTALMLIFDVDMIKGWHF